MENKINVAKLLKDCPSGMELDCTMFDGVEFDSINEESIVTPIMCRIKLPNGNYNFYNFTKCGCWSNTEYSKCVIFPKGKTTWEGFQRSFKNGDIAISNRGDIHLLRTEDSSYCAYRESWKGLNQFDKTITTCVDIVRLATEEEKEKLFQAIKENGYKWNAEKKELEKLIEPKFKVGDEIVKRGSIVNSWIVSSVSSEYYRLQLPKGSEDIGVIPISEQDDWELVPNKFDISTLKEFDKVLVRCNSLEKWHIQFFEKYNTESSEKYPFICLCNSKYCQCIPYNDETKHLLGTTNDCDDFYKTW